MQLTLKKEELGGVVLIRCQGRIVVGDEIRALQREVEEAPLPLLQGRKVVLDLAEVSFIDSAGVGTLVRLLGVLRAHGGDLKLCRLSPFVAKVLEVTNLRGVLASYASEQEAAQAFHKASQHPSETFESTKTRIVCTDDSHDLLAYLKALLARSGYEVLTTRRPSEALTLVKVTRPHLVICGPGMQANQIAMDGLRMGAPGARLLLLPADFSAADAGHAGTNLVEQVRSLIGSRP
jgi:anti-anti-sigma factor